MSQQIVRQVGPFTGSGHTELLFYYPESGQWWLGSFSNQQLHWRLADNTAGFGNLLQGHKFWVGNFTSLQQLDLLFYYPGDGNWWLGRFTQTRLNWKLVGNTAGFGNLADGRPFWTGNFTGSGRTDLLFFSPRDNHWWLGYFVGTHLQWTLANGPDQSNS
jgi:hypothetical protein